MGEGIAANFNDGGSSLGVESTNKIKAIPSLGVVAYYDRNWNQNWSTAIGFSINRQDNLESQTDNAFKQGTLAQVNLLYTSGQFMNGFEIIWSERENKDGQSNDDARIMYSMKYSFDHLF